jgi:hypothetical protein
MNKIIIRVNRALVVYTIYLVYSTSCLVVLHLIMSFILDKVFSLSDFFLTTVNFGWHESISNTLLSIGYLFIYYALVVSASLLMVAYLLKFLSGLFVKKDSIDKSE